MVFRNHKSQQYKFARKRLILSKVRGGPLQLSHYQTSHNKFHIKKSSEPFKPESQPQSYLRKSELRANLQG